MQVLSWKGASWNAVLEPLFPGIDITDNFLSPTEFWITLCIPEPIFFKKKIILLRSMFFENNTL
jgi:hypothetical protein